MLALLGGATIVVVSRLRVNFRGRLEFHVRLLGVPQALFLPNEIGIYIYIYISKTLFIVPTDAHYYIIIEC